MSTMEERRQEKFGPIAEALKDLGWLPAKDLAPCILKFGTGNEFFCLGFVSGEPENARLFWHQVSGSQVVAVNVGNGGDLSLMTEPQKLRSSVKRLMSEEMGIYPPAKKEVKGLNEENYPPITGANLLRSPEAKLNAGWCVDAEICAEIELMTILQAKELAVLKDMLCWQAQHVLYQRMAPFNRMSMDVTPTQISMFRLEVTKAVMQMMAPLKRDIPKDLRIGFTSRNDLTIPVISSESEPIINDLFGNLYSALDPGLPENYDLDYEGLAFIKKAEAILAKEPSAVFARMFLHDLPKLVLVKEQRTPQPMDLFECSSCGAYGQIFQFKDKLDLQANTTQCDSCDALLDIRGVKEKIMEVLKTLAAEMERPK